MKRVQITKPSKSAVDGRDSKGRFAPGNKASLGNVAARKAARCRTKLFNAVSMSDFRAVVRRVLKEAMAGEAWACKLLFAYMLGPPVEADLLARIDEMEEAVRAMTEQPGPARMGAA